MAKKKTLQARTKRPTRKPISRSTRTVRKPVARTVTPAKATVMAPTTNGHTTVMDPDAVRKIKSQLTSRELKDYRNLLLLKRAEILGDMKSMSSEALNGDSTNLSHMPIHMADVGSDHYEQELTLGLVESERKLLHEIDEALERIAEGTFGICQATGKPIGKPRLQAKPWAKYSIEAAREMERHAPRW